MIENKKSGRLAKSVYNILHRSTRFSQNLVITNAHTVAEKSTAPVSQGEKNCPAYSQICHNCDRTGHFQQIKEEN